ncbi:hypothetical protein R5W24_002672 [Gemmata sp. JC717]|uniref:Uncharacterized protein n=1 Tax=Gemmata algarum TaxID=2975278 RepID=A0ABU5F446_9BACT|nr:hypothetical protein [Gemmata algarum]MDY3553569.1 hypothetical protein [Gemmata algarum]MDY3560938.1 hypothetical protein [Gemmata algarum]
MAKLLPSGEPTARLARGSSPSSDQGAPALENSKTNALSVATSTNRPARVNGTRITAAENGPTRREGSDGACRSQKSTAEPRPPAASQRPSGGNATV